MKLELSEPDIIFRPSLDNNIVNNFHDQVTGWLEDITAMGKLIPRIAYQEKDVHESEKQKAENYYHVRGLENSLIYV